MNPVKKAIWLVEKGLDSELTLDDLAADAGVSRFYLARAFAAATGHSVMGYVRARRLTRAAHALAGGAGDILSVALDAGYASHEAFTRAFRERFGLTPEQAREAGGVDPSFLVEALSMYDMKTIDLKAPRIETRDAILLAGLSSRFHCDHKQDIPALWMRFGPLIESIGHRPTNDDAFGAVANMDEAGNFDYFAAVAVTDYDETPPELSRLRVPGTRYAVFQHGGHISQIGAVMNAIWSGWLATSGHEPADATLLEYYPGSFDPKTGGGGFEVWFPIKA